MLRNGRRRRENGSATLTTGTEQTAQMAKRQHTTEPACATRRLTPDVSLERTAKRFGAVARKLADLESSNSSLWHQVQSQRDIIRAQENQIAVLRPDDNKW